MKNGMDNYLEEMQNSLKKETEDFLEFWSQSIYPIKYV